MKKGDQDYKKKGDQDYNELASDAQSQGSKAHLAVPARVGKVKNNKAVKKAKTKKDGDVNIEYLEGEESS